MSEHLSKRSTLETRERLLESAEKLFAEYGYDGTSVRDITADAECNVAAVNYHFGSKEELYQATFRRLLVGLQDYRIRRIRENMEEMGSSATLEDFLLSFATAFVEPLFDGGRGPVFMAFFDEEMRNHRMSVETLHRDLVEPMLRITDESLRRIGIVLEPDTLTLCMMSVVGQLLHSIKARQLLAENVRFPMLSIDGEKFNRHFVVFSAAGIRACAGADAATLERRCDLEQT
jgi:AcrR family transcriptional regulator